MWITLPSTRGWSAPLRDACALVVPVCAVDCNLLLPVPGSRGVFKCSWAVRVPGSDQVMNHLGGRKLRWGQREDVCFNLDTYIRISLLSACTCGCGLYRAA